MKEQLIECLHCGNSYTRQYKTTIYERGEDDKFGKKYTIIGKELKIFKKSKLNGNPSDRRDGITIDIKCEFCGKDTKINIIQHKGQTFIEITK